MEQLRRKKFDLIIGPPELANKVNKFEVNHAENFKSDHFPVHCEFILQNVAFNTSRIKSLNFKKANRSDYKRLLEDTISIEEIVNFNVNDLYQFICNCIINASNKTIPLNVGKIHRKE